MQMLREAWSNDVLLSMASSFCVGLGVGIALHAFFIPHPWAFLPLGVAMPLLWAGCALIGRAEVMRFERWERREWR